jgi:hypothetical protein
MATSRFSSGRASARLSNVSAVHELFVAGQMDEAYLGSTPLRPVVADSWRRSLAIGVDPDIVTAQSSSVDVALDEMRPPTRWRRRFRSSAGC